MVPSLRAKREFDYTRNCFICVSRASLAWRVFWRKGMSLEMSKSEVNIVSRQSFIGLCCVHYNVASDNAQDAHDTLVVRAALMKPIL